MAGPRLESPRRPRALGTSHLTVFVGFIPGAARDSPAASHPPSARGVRGVHPHLDRLAGAARRPARPDLAQHGRQRLLGLVIHLDDQAFGAVSPHRHGPGPVPRWPRGTRRRYDEVVVAPVTVPTGAAGGRRSVRRSANSRAANHPGSHRTGPRRPAGSRGRGRHRRPRLRPVRGGARARLHRSIDAGGVLGGVQFGPIEK